MPETSNSVLARSVDTPAVLVERGRLEHNIASYARVAAESGVGLRPHVKTHKTIEIARMQLAAGADGITVAKLSEAEVYAAAGFEDIFVAYPVIGEQKWARAAKLAQSCRLIVGVESAEGAEGLHKAALRYGTTIEVRAELDSGLHRSGVQPDAMADLCRFVLDQVGLRLSGIFTFRSSAYEGSTGRTAEQSGSAEGELMVALAETLRSQGIPVEQISGGSTPTGPAVARVPGVTEIRPGTYVFQDRMTVADGVPQTDLALSVLTTVVSRPSEAVAIVDAGSKTLAADIWPASAGLKGFAEVAGGLGTVAWTNEEHGAVDLADGFRPRVGDVLRLVPNHVCTVVNLSDELVVVDGDQVVDRWAVAAGHCRT